jgi:hypothetical protein
MEMYAAITLSVAVVILATAAAVIILRRLRTAQDAGVYVVLARGPDGEMVVPVRGLFKGGAKNSLRPFLAITPDGLRFRVLMEERWTFAELARVDAGPALFGASLEFKSRTHGALAVSVAGLHVARQVLQALPKSVETTPRAAAVRDGSSFPSSSSGQPSG